MKSEIRSNGRTFDPFDHLVGRTIVSVHHYPATGHVFIFFGEGVVLTFQAATGAMLSGPEGPLYTISYRGEHVPSPKALADLDRATSEKT